ncbi:MAG: C-terminal helicase domain-containing protein, partial [Chloroflexota bacterium]|nr:C-terminal helicase domain-containing protein [Chloroflexota bacterium]
AGLITGGPPIQFIDTSNDPRGVDRGSTVGDDSRSNEHEAEIIAGLIWELISGLDADGQRQVLTEVGVISPYRRQNNAIHQALARRDPGLSAAVRVDTVDRFQGGEKEIVLLSLTNSNAQASIGRLHAEWRRMNVAISRARRSLVLVGDRRTFTAQGDDAEEPAKSYYRRLFAAIDRLRDAGEARIVASTDLRMDCR